MIGIFLIFTSLWLAIAKFTFYTETESGLGYLINMTMQHPYDLLSNSGYYITSLFLGFSTESVSKSELFNTYIGYDVLIILSIGLFMWANSHKKTLKKRV